MTALRSLTHFLGATAAIAAIAGCASIATEAAPAIALSTRVHSEAEFEADRQAILAMAGEFDVRFDFVETVAFTEGYAPKDRYVSGAHEVVRVIEDRGEFISLQHILVVGGDEAIPIKHWRQDWAYEPEEVLVFVGGNAWETRAVPEAERSGRWSQTVYQVDDSPRYGAVGAWSHANGVSEWTPPAEMRPLPRRDMTTRDDYHAVLAVNRHAITPDGWVHEQDNSKLVLTGEPHVLVREIGVNTYTRFDEFTVAAADDYWTATADYWANVRAEWTRLEDELPAFALTLQGEPEDLYAPLLDYAEAVAAGEMELAAAAEAARATIAEFTTAELGTLEDRLRPASVELAGR